MDLTFPKKRRRRSQTTRKKMGIARIGDYKRRQSGKEGESSKKGLPSILNTGEKGKRH